MYSIHSPETQKRYPDRFKAFLDFIQTPGTNIEERLLNFNDKAKQDPQWLQSSLMDFILFQKKRVQKGEIAASTISNYYKPIKLFCEVNDIPINWKFISRGIPRGKHASDDRAPTLEEIHQLLKYPDIRIRPIVLVMVSSGIRIAAWDYLKWKHIIPIKNEEGVIIAAKIIVYAGDPEQYYSFITSEAYYSLQNWMQYRSTGGEKISVESWVMRDLWKTTNMSFGSRYGSATQPLPLRNEAIRTILCRALLHQNIRGQLKEGQKRHEFKAAHGFRKYFKTHCEKVMRSVNIELLMGHNIGLSKSYYKPTEKELLEDYLNAIDLLTINEEHKLKKQVKELAKKNNEKEFMLNVAMMQKDKEVEELKKQDKIKEEALLKLSDQVMLLMKEMQDIKSTKSMS